MTPSAPQRLTGKTTMLGDGMSIVHTLPGARRRTIGGEPLQEPLLIWWNFVARTQQELVMACADWNAGARYFGEVAGYPGRRLEAPLPPW